MTAEEDIALIRRGYASWNSGDLDDLLEICSDDIEVHPVLGDVVSADTFTGKDGVRRWRQSILNSLAELRVDLLDIVEGDRGRYLALLRFDGRGMASGARVTLDAAHLLTVRDGLLVSLVGYESWDAGGEAL
jgi:ketosteroid isomerase-like protein